MFNNKITKRIDNIVSTIIEIQEEVGQARKIFYYPFSIAVSSEREPTGIFKKIEELQNKIVLLEKYLKVNYVPESKEVKSAHYQSYALPEDISQSAPLSNKKKQ